MITAQEQVRQITHGVSGIINEEDLVKKIERSIDRKIGPRSYGS